MTSYRIERYPFDVATVASWRVGRDLHDWPVVYSLSGTDQVYVGETTSAVRRLSQHLADPRKRHLSEARLIIHEESNKSVCLDLEGYLVGLLAGEGHLEVLNSPATTGTGEYFERARYRAQFAEIFEALRQDGLFSLPLEEIRNSDLFKLSPFKMLTDEQGAAVVTVIERLLQDLRAEQFTRSTSVVEGDPGTGKTIVGVFLMKVLRDIADWDEHPIENETYLTGLFTPEAKEQLSQIRIGLVVPQQSLRTSVREVFTKTPGLDASMILSPFDVGKSATSWDVLIVDETHRLGQRANQASAQKNREFSEINAELFGSDDNNWTQLDWIRQQSRHQILLVDVHQRVKPADLGHAMLVELRDQARSHGRHHRLTSQLRVAAGEDYVEYVRQVLSDQPPSTRIDFGEYDVRYFDDPTAMIRAIHEREGEEGLARVLAGFAWEWKSKRDKHAADFIFPSSELKWNTRVVDWVDSPTSIDEVGSIHTIQGYDLNYAGVIIGRDIRLDPSTGRLAFDRNNYFDKKGKQNNPGSKTTDAELLEFVRNIYSVLLTRGMKGTYIHVVDPDLREHLRPFFDQVEYRLP